jgi:hypothetical protein
MEALTHRATNIKAGSLLSNPQKTAGFEQSQIRPTGADCDLRIFMLLIFRIIDLSNDSLVNPQIQVSYSYLIENK